MGSLRFSGWVKPKKGVHTNLLLAEVAAPTPYAQYLLLGVMAILAVGFACGPLILSAILAPKKAAVLCVDFRGAK